MAEFLVEAGNSLSLQGALDRAGPGDIVTLQPGDHRSLGIVRRGGAKGSPLIIRGTDGARFVGSRPPAKLPRDWLPSWDDAQAFRLNNIEHVSFQHIGFAECWPVAVFARNVRWIEFRRCSVRAGTFPFYVRDWASLGDASRNISVKQCTWIQDERIWAKLPWDDVHHGDWNFLSGGLIGMTDVIGDVTFSGNEITDAFNGFVADISPELRRDWSKVQERNVNFRIADNKFMRVRDNPIEPETWARNWHIYGNSFFNCHAWFSMDHVSGGHWYIYANTGWFDDRPSTPEWRRRTGEVFKIAKLPRRPLYPVYVFNNSFHLRAPVFGNAQDDEYPYIYSFQKWSLRDNAIERCTTGSAPPPGSRDQPICEAVIHPFEDAAIFDLDPSNRFDGNVTNNPLWFDYLRARGQERNGHPVANAVFVNGARGQFSLMPGSPGRGAAKPFEVEIADGSRFTVKSGGNTGSVQELGVVSDWPPYTPI
jgi:hypothetical protein